VSQDIAPTPQAVLYQLMGITSMDIIWALALSTHLGMQGSYNETHPHVRLEDNGYIAGAYYNSMERMSLYAGHRFESGNAGLELALVTGYDEFGAIAPYVRGTYDIGNTRVFVAPAGETWYGETNIGAVIGIEIQIK
jgi:hypothetical protein